jgi:glycosyltransferase involved in cell wall biosynthesis
MKATFSILITTKNRKDDLTFTLQAINHLLVKENVVCIICDDGSTDGTFEMVQDHFPHIELIRNIKSKGLIYSRNRMMNRVTSDYAISLDDDLHFLVQEPLESIEKYFEANPKCAIQSFRIFWNKKSPDSFHSNQKQERTKSFAGGAHVWKMEAWKEIPQYPDWFIFYGEEDFAAFQLFKKHWEIHYVPDILVHHRVDIKARKKSSDYRLRTRRSFRSSWYLYLLFFPFRLIPEKLLYTLWVQIKNKTFKGDWKATLGILQALGDVILNIPRLMQQSNRLTTKEFQEFSKLSEIKLYWKPEDEK